MKKNILLLMVLILTMGMSVEKVSAANDWTFMVYLDADNNLEAAGIDDFLEMSSVGSDANINIVVQFDRVAGYDTTHDDWQTCKRFRVTLGMTPSAANAISDIGEANMGDPATLTAFINWATTNYPANNYALILWDHGDGWRTQQGDSLVDVLKMAQEGEADGAIQKALEERETLYFKTICSDDTNGDTLYMSEVESALNNANVDMDLVGFDACLMGMIEVGYQIRQTGASVMVGSEHTEPGDGWPYNTILNDLTSNQTWNSVQLGAAIVDRYYASYGNDQTQSSICLRNEDEINSLLIF